MRLSYYSGDHRPPIMRTKDMYTEDATRLFRRLFLGAEGEFGARHLSEVLDHAELWNKYDQLIFLISR